MKALLIAPRKALAWAEALPPAAPLLLPIVNKPYLEYLLDLATLLKIREVRVVTDAPDLSLEREIESGARWGLDLSLAFLKEGDGPAAVLAKNSRFCGDEPLLVFSGFPFVFYDAARTAADYGFDPPSGSHRWSAPGGEMAFLAGGRAEASRWAALTPPAGPTFGLTGLTSMGDYFALSQRILSGSEGAFVLPGYNNEPGVHIGQDVEMAKSAVVEKPVMIGNRVKLGQGCTIGPGAILGGGVVVDRRTVVRRAIVASGTYVGADVEIEGKIVAGSRLIDPVSGQSLDVPDRFLVAPLKSGGARRTAGRIASSAAALGLGLLLLAPFLLAAPFIGLRKKPLFKRTCVFADESRRAVRARRLRPDAPRFAARAARFFGADKFLLLGGVLKGDWVIAGCRPLECDPLSSARMREIKGYRPGVFFASERTGNTDETARMFDDQEFLHSRRFGRRAALVLGTLGRRIISGGRESA